MSLLKGLFLVIIMFVSFTYGTILHIGMPEKEKYNIEIPIAPIVEPDSTYGTEPTPSYVTGFEEDRIIGGEITNIKEFPYLVNIEMLDVHSCGGSYISAHWVLTAAHCVTFNQQVVLTCSMGMTFLNDFEMQQRNASSVHPHKDYNPRNDSNDIGLIKIDKPFELNAKVSLIKVATQSIIDSSIRCRVSGWGIMNQDDMRDRTKLSNQLRFVEIPIISQQRCGELYYIDRFRKHFLTNLVFCAGYEEGGFDACQGDSGGPFVCNNIQVGIVSWGIGCGNELPGVYTNVTSFIDWIKQVMHFEDPTERRGDVSVAISPRQNPNNLIIFFIRLFSMLIMEVNVKLN